MSLTLEEVKSDSKYLSCLFSKGLDKIPDTLCRRWLKKGRLRIDEESFIAQKGSINPDGLWFSTLWKRFRIFPLTVTVNLWNNIRLWFRVPKDVLMFNVTESHLRLVLLLLLRMQLDRTITCSCKSITNLGLSSVYRYWPRFTNSARRSMWK